MSNKSRRPPSPPTTLRPELTELVCKYLTAKQWVIEAGFEWEIVWQENVRPDKTSESDFLREAAWVILSSGMRETVIRKLFPKVSTAFLNWRSAKDITSSAAFCVRRARRHFDHSGKLQAIASLCRHVSKVGISAVLEELTQSGPAYLLSFPFLGPATSKHLAKNLGFDVAKPDRHLKRLAAALSYPTADDLCREIGSYLDERAAVVDVVLWRYATARKSYIDFFTGAALTESTALSPQSLFRHSVPAPCLAF